MARTGIRPDEGGELTPVGVSDHDEAVYRTLLAYAAASPGELAAELGATTDRIDAALVRLRSLGLVSRLSGRAKRYTAVEPDAAIEALVRARSAELERVRSTSMAFSAIYHAVQHEAGRGAEIELLGSAELGRWFVRLQHQVRDEMLVLDRPPYALAATNPIEPVSLAQGVRWRAIYAPEALEEPGAIEEVQALAASGEHGRVLDGLPMKLAIADRKIALLPLSFDLATTGVALIRESTLLDALINLFEIYWQQAIPIGHRQAEGDQQPDDQVLITLLAAGLTDNAIARQMGWSTRTMRRRTRSLYESLSASNRFQAGVQAARRGLL